MRNGRKAGERISKNSTIRHGQTNGTMIRIVDLKEERIGDTSTQRMEV
jgi:hypothetical protein